MTKQADSFTQVERDRPAIEITDEMIEAGVHELRGLRYGESLEEVVQSIYVAMWVEAYGDARRLASEIAAS